MAAALTQHPELFRAVVSLVGIYDMLRVELDPNALFNTTEFGTVKDAAVQSALCLSSCRRSTARVIWPSSFMATDENDGRVNPMQ
jgi:prolyl oligopeptidase